MEFTSRYKALNAAQKEAVDHIDGPVMVVAGPGTGKTELLSVRVANILDKTDALPSNILCLTFTDSGAVAMRERLAGLIGPEAYKVAIHTFHSFGSEIINRYGEYFYHGAHFRPADELSTYQILSDILEKLPHKHPLAGMMGGVFTHLRDIKSTISDLKKSGLIPDELTAILDRGDAFASWLTPRLQPIFSQRMSNKLLPLLHRLADDMAGYQEEPLAIVNYSPLSAVLGNSLRTAITTAETSGTTKPLTAWKNAFISKDSHGQFVLSDHKRSEKLRATAQVYYEYLVAMQAHELYDYDDMILRVVHAMEVFAELRFGLQEQYQYILIDEFQDTNDAQMRLVWNLTNNETQAGRPNLMVVGDDDQAIYRFQGATMSNIVDFSSRYRDVRVVTLRDNYRSGADILAVARRVITQGEERLETTLGLDKTLAPHQPSPGTVVFESYATEYEARDRLAQRIRAAYQKDSTKTRAVIARTHRQLVALLPHLQHYDIPLRYERQEDILESEPVRQLELVGRIVHYVALQQFDEANELLPELLAHPAWAVSAREVWQLSVSAHRSGRFWLEEMLDQGGRLQDIAEWVIVASHLALSEPLEHMCDYLFGTTEESQAADTSDAEIPPDQPSTAEDFVSPYRAYFFPAGSLDTTPGAYMSWLLALTTLRSALREFRPMQPLVLEDLIDFIDLYREMELRIPSRGEVQYDSSAVTLLTAHKAKGLEFDEVYIADATEPVWGSSARSRSRLISFPSNLPLAPAGDSDDERLRLLYVALTRAKDLLVLTAPRSTQQGKAVLPVGMIAPHIIAPIELPALAPAQQITALESDWRTPLFDVPTATKYQLLRPLVDRYKLSSTHLNNFLDVSRGGPQLFLLHNLLRFPQAMSPSAVYGSAIHTALQRAHAHLTATGKRRPSEDVLHDFEESLRQHQLHAIDFDKQLQRGSQVLARFLAERYDSFSPRQRVEQNFSTESIVVGSAIITGAIDLLDIDTDEKTIFITDYKTGKTARQWKGTSDYERIKLHHYEQQLMMYRLLVEQSRQFEGYRVSGARIEFVEPDERGDIVLLDYVYDDNKMAEFRRLLEAVWQRIQALEFYTVTYEPSIKGILAFEHDLVSSVI